VELLIEHKESSVVHIHSLLLAEVYLNNLYSFITNNTEMFASITMFLLFSEQNSVKLES
jgi:hypothetical protein